MNNDNWKASLKEFFAQRGLAISGKPLQIEDLAYVSGRDPRVWTSDVYKDLILDIIKNLVAGRDSSILEVGCASGFLANGLSPHVASYEGLDIAEPALVAARQLGLGNAHFSLGDGAALPYDANSFDAALCYDVFTNFPNFQVGADLITEMLRTTRPGGQVLIGSIPDSELQEAYVEKVAEVARDLQEKHGPLSQHYVSLGERILADNRSWLQRMLRKPHIRVDASIHCYYFDKRDFEKLGEELGVHCEITDVHALNPYRGFRFNVTYKKPG